MVSNGWIRRLGYCSASVHGRGLAHDRLRHDLCSSGQSLERLFPFLSFSPSLLRFLQLTHPSHPLLLISQDKLDDALAGVKSTALLFAHQTKPILSLFSVTIVSLLAYTGYLASCSPAYYVISVAGTAAHLGWQLKSVDLDVRSSCWRVFKSNKWLGGLISLGLGVDYWWRVGGGREMVGVEKREEGEERK